MRPQPRLHKRLAQLLAAKSAPQTAQLPHQPDNWLRSAPADHSQAAVPDWQKAQSLPSASRKAVANPVAICLFGLATGQTYLTCMNT